MSRAIAAASPTERVGAVEAVEAFRNHHMSSGTPPRDRSRPPQNREALEKVKTAETPARRPYAVRSMTEQRDVSRTVTDRGPPPGGGTQYAPTEQRDFSRVVSDP